MNPDNPYAAPQTIDPDVSSSDLAQGEVSERKLYDDVSTERLSRLAHWSMVIHVMTITLGVLLVVAAVSCLFMPMLFGLAIFAFIIALRVWGGLKRTPWFWLYDLLFDACSCGGLIVWFFALIEGKVLAKVELSQLLLMGTPMLLLAVMAGSSVLAHLCASHLYIHFSHQELIAEARYRKQQSIA